MSEKITYLKSVYVFLLDLDKYGNQLLIKSNILQIVYSANEIRKKTIIQ